MLGEKKKKEKKKALISEILVPIQKPILKLRLQNPIISSLEICCENNAY